MTKGQLIELIQRNVSGQGSKTNRYDLRIIELYCSLAYSQLMQEALTAGRFSAEFFAKSYNVAVALNSTNNVYYSNLPVQILQLPNGETGIISIASLQGKSMEFLPAYENDLRLFEDTEVSSVIDQIFYTVYFDKVEYSSNIGDDVVSNGVRMQLIRAFEAIADTENVNIPNAKDVDFVNIVVNMIKGIPPIDLGNKNTD